MLNCRIAKMLTLLVAINPRPALSNASLVNALKVRDTNTREVVDELNPDDTNGCFSLGELDIVFRSDNSGPPNVGIVLTDPLGLPIVFYLLNNHPCQSLPFAQR